MAACSRVGEASKGLERGQIIANAEKMEEDAPGPYECSICLDLMVDPVVGRTFATPEARVDFCRYSRRLAAVKVHHCFTMPRYPLYETSEFSCCSLLWARLLLPLPELLAGTITEQPHPKMPHLSS